MNFSNKLPRFILVFVAVLDGMLIGACLTKLFLVQETQMGLDQLNIFLGAVLWGFFISFIIALIVVFTVSAEKLSIIFRVLALFFIGMLVYIAIIANT